MAERFVLGVDLDGVCADFYKAIRAVAAEWLGVPITDLSEEVSYGLPEWGFDRDRYPEMHRFAVTQRELFRSLDPISNAPAVLRRLAHEHDVHVRVITHRLFIPHFHQEAVRQTIEWLDYHGIPYRDLCFTGEKVAVGADLYIEDSPDNVVALRTVRPTIVFTNSTNRHLGGLRADDWVEAERLVLEQKAEWQANQRADGKSVTGN